MLTHLPGKVSCTARHSLLYPNQVTYKEIEEMIRIVDKNGDGKVSYSEFRVGQAWQHCGVYCVIPALDRYVSPGDDGSQAAGPHHLPPAGRHLRPAAPPQQILETTANT